MNGKLMYAAGVAVGAVCAWYWTREHYISKFQEILDEHEEYVQERKARTEEIGQMIMDGFRDGMKDYADRIDEERYRSHKGVFMVKDELDAVSQEVNDDDFDDHHADRENPREDISENDPVISLESYEEEMLGYAKLSLVYYDEDDALINEEDDGVYYRGMNDVVEQLLTHFGEQSGHPDKVYGRNHALEEDYEITRLHRSYSKDVLGLEED